MADLKNDKTQQNIYIDDLQLKDSDPSPVADRSYFVYNDLKKGDIRQDSFILRNTGGPFEKLTISTLSKDSSESFLKITGTKPLIQEQVCQLPLEVFFEAKAIDWSRRYTDTILIKMDIQEEKVVVNLDTQTKPVDDFAHIFNDTEIKKMTSLVERLEKTTTAEVAIVTLNTLDGKDIEKYANSLFNEWGIGKENIHNGLLVLIDADEHKYRVEVGFGLEKLITPEFIDGLALKYFVPYFKEKKFGKGVYLTLSEIFAKIYKNHKIE